jgi:hypothetical protein
VVFFSNETKFTRIIISEVNFALSSTDFLKC